MKIIIAVLAVMPLFANAAQSVAGSSYHRPPEFPCGDYYREDCDPKPKPWEDCFTDRCPHGPRPLPWNGVQELTSAQESLAKGNTAAAARSLDSIFSGSTGKKNEAASAVFVGAGVGAARSFSRLKPAGIKTAGLREKDKEGFKIVKTGVAEAAGGAVIGIIIEKGVDAADKALNDYVNRDQTQESIDKYGGCRLKGTC